MLMMMVHARDLDDGDGASWRRTPEDEKTDDKKYPDGKMDHKKYPNGEKYPDNKKYYSGHDKYMDTMVQAIATRTNMDTSHTGTGFGGTRYHMAMASIMMAMAQDHSYEQY